MTGVPCLRDAQQPRRSPPLRSVPSSPSGSSRSATCCSSARTSTRPPPLDATAPRKSKRRTSTGWPPRACVSKAPSASRRSAYLRAAPSSPASIRIATAPCILSDALSEDVPTVADLFRGEGYQTAAIGKMHFVDESRRHGFQHRIHSADFNRRLTTGEIQGAPPIDQGGAGGTTASARRLPERLFQDTFYAEETIDYPAAEPGPTVLPVVVVLHAAHAAGSVRRLLGSV
jgi:hypothetical protein